MKLSSLARVSRQGYYKGLEQKPSLKELGDLLLSDVIKKIYDNSEENLWSEACAISLEGRERLNCWCETHSKDYAAYHLLFAVKDQTMSSQHLNIRLKT